MKFRPTLLAAGSAITIGAMAFLMSVPAQAYVVCNDQGDCWHATTHYDVPNVHVTFYDDNWDWKAHNYHWHDADGDAPGYWDTQDNKWVTVKKTTTTTTTTTATPPQ